MSDSVSNTEYSTVLHNKKKKIPASRDREAAAGLLNETTGGLLFLSDPNIFS
jgi:hypothetical protein